MGFGKYFGEIEVDFQFCGVVGCAGLAMVLGTAETVAQIPKESIEQVLSATDIVDLVGSYIQLKRAGSQFRANCPFHTEKTPSFYVTPSMQRFHCFGCGKGGDAISFVCDYENLPFTDAVRKLASKAGIHLNEDADDPHADAKRKVRGRLLDLHREAAEFFHERLLNDPDAQHARDYLKSRGFGREMAERWAVGWMPENSQVFLEWARSRKFTGRELCGSGMASLRDEGNPRSGLYVRFRDRLMFSIRNEIGDVIAFSGRQLKEDKRSGKYINSPETATFKKATVLFGLDRAKKPILKEKSALLCEGQIDAIACHEAGIEHAIAPLGTAFTPQHAKKLRRYTNEVLICYDGDDAGIKASGRAFRELVTEGLSVRVVRLPAGDDPDTYLKRDGVEAFRDLLKNAVEFFDFKLEKAKEKGLLQSAADRSAVLSECTEILSLMNDFAARENQINMVATLLQTSATVLRQQIALIKSQPKRAPRDYAAAEVDVVVPVAVQTPMHRIVVSLCHLTLSSGAAQHFLGEQFEALHEARRWLEGIPLLESILVAGPDPSSSAAVNTFLSGLSEPDRLALTHEAVMKSAPVDGMQAAEMELALLSATVLQKRDSSVKAAMKDPHLTAERMVELLEEAKEIGALLSGIGQRSEFDDELPASTWKPKEPEWKKKWKNKG